MEPTTIEFPKITVAGQEHSSITISDYKAEDWLTSFKQLNGVGLEEGRQRQIHFLMWKMSDKKDMKVIDSLSGSTYRKVQKVVMDFLALNEEDGNPISES